MRRTRSAWIAGALGVGLTASVVLAQQVSNSGVAPQGGAGAPSEPASLYGAAGSRGARYLLRNGLDYLGYQQYERALKFLRDAEAKEKELSAAERRELKRGIEQAQAGLRAAADTGAAPYALSDRSRRRNGFSPARPEPGTAVAARGAADRRPEPAADVTPKTEWAGPVARGRRRPLRDAADAGGDAVFGAMARRDAGRKHAEDAPGEPIRLASAEGETSPPAQAGGAAPRTGPDGATEAANASPPADPLSVKGEIPALDAPGLPNLTAVPPSPDAARPKAPQEGSAPPPAAPGGAIPAPADPAQGTPEPAPASTTTTGPAADPAAPAPIPAESAPAPIPLETPDSPTGAARTPDVAPAPSSPAAPAVMAPEASVPPAVSGPATTTDASSTPGASPSPKEATPAAPAESGRVAPESSSAPAPSGVPALAPAGDAAAGGTSTPAPATGGLVPAGMKEPAAPETGLATPGDGSAGASAAAEPAPAADRTDIAPLPPLGADATRAGEVAGAPHRESEEPAAPAPGATSPDPAAMSAPAVAATAGSDELPPLPTDLGGRDAAAEPLPDPAPAASSVKPGLAPAVDAGAPSASDPASSPSPSDTTRAEPNAPAVGAEAPTAAPVGPAPSPAVEAPLPPLPDAETGSGPGTPVAPAPAPSADRAGESTAATPTTAPEPAGPSPSAPAGAANQDAPGAAAPAERDITAEERPIPVPQPDAATGAEAATGPAMAPAPEATPPAGAAPSSSSVSAESNFFLPPRTSTPSPRLRPEQERQVAEMIARQEKEDLVRSQSRTQPQPAAPMGREAGTSNLQTQTQYDISRAPSPAEARPIKAIPVPEDWVPLAPRNWTPQRKYWSAAATCHLPLYFQDPVLERYGHPVEQFAGPVGRYLTYPVDDPNQSTQRMQILQPFFSAGLFALQIAAWPYNAVMDPPWEAQYDLGYYRPGDMVPVDVYWLPLHGYGPPLRGNSY